MIDVYILGHAKTLEYWVNNRCSFMKGPLLSLTIHCEPVFRRAHYVYILCIMYIYIYICICQLLNTLLYVYIYIYSPGNTLLAASPNPWTCFTKVVPDYYQFTSSKQTRLDTEQIVPKVLTQHVPLQRHTPEN